MASRKEKEAIVREIKEDFQKASVVVLTEYRGLTVSQINQLRRILKGEGVKYKVLKNTLTRLATKEEGLEELHPYLEGPTAIAYGYDDPVTPIKLLVKFSKEHEDLTIKGGVLDKVVYNETEIRRLSELPPKGELLARTLGSLQSPLAGFLNVLQGNMRGLVSVLNAVKEKKESA
ncbi:MAG: 50S ribosomal protein L10 [Dethiobacteria bacterium]|jgi:large subunit ribosomal protein L10